MSERMTAELRELFDKSGMEWLEVNDIAYLFNRIAALERVIKDEIDKWPVPNTDHPLYKALSAEVSDG